MMEAACRCTAKSLRFLHPHIPHAVAVMVMAIAFHTKDLDGVGYKLNIFLFPNLSPSSGFEAALLIGKWYSILGGGTLTYFSDTILLMGKQKVVTIEVWDKAKSQLKAWAVFFTFSGRIRGPPCHLQYVPPPGGDIWVHPEAV